MKENSGAHLVLTLDPFKRRMYWVDSESEHLMSSNMDGNNQNKIYDTGDESSAMDLHGKDFFELFHSSCTYKHQNNCNIYNLCGV